MNLEIKQKSPFLVPDLCELIRKKKKEDLLIASRWHSVLSEVSQQCPELATSASALEIINFQIFDNVLGLRYRSATDVIQSHSRFGLPIITKGSVEAAHKLDLQVHAWTVNEHEEMHRMISLGVDAIITDHPTALLSLLERKSPNPASGS
jgi:glycerophosphoryl diester phosphodiesterase